MLGGRYQFAFSSSCISPLSYKIIIANAVNCLATEATVNFVSIVFLMPNSRFEYPRQVSNRILPFRIILTTPEKSQ